MVARALKAAAFSLSYRTGIGTRPKRGERLVKVMHQDAPGAQARHTKYHLAWATAAVRRMPHACDGLVLWG